MSGPQKVAEYVRDRIKTWRDPNPLTPEEMELAPHIRGNEKLYAALTQLIGTRIGGRQRLPVPPDPLTCKSMLERDNELRWLLNRLEACYRSAVSPDTGEQPTR